MRFYPSAEKQSAYFKAPAGRVTILTIKLTFMKVPNVFIDICHFMAKSGTLSDFSYEKIIDLHSFFEFENFREVIN